MICVVQDFRESNAEELPFPELHLGNDAIGGQTRFDGTDLSAVEYSQLPWSLRSSSNEICPHPAGEPADAREDLGAVGSEFKLCASVPVIPVR